MHPEKMLYEASDTTKANVEYFTAVASLLMTFAGNRPGTRKRWLDGTEAGSFFERNHSQHGPNS